MGALLRSPFVLTFLSAICIVVPSRVPALCWLSLFALIPVLVALHDKPLKQWMRWSGFLFFLVALGAYYWIYDVSTNFGHLAPWAAVLGVGIFALFNIWQGLIGFALFRWLSDHIHLPKALLFAICLASAWQFTPALFFWDYSLLVRHWTWLIQSLDIFGTFGLDLFVFYISYALYEVWQTRRFVSSTRIALVVLCVLHGYGAWRCHHLTNDLAEAPTVRVALIQANLDSGRKSDPRFIQESIAELMRLSDAAATKQPNLIVWPESVFPIDYQRDPGLRRVISEATTRWSSALFFGGNEFERRTDGGWRSYNASTLVLPGSDEAQSYRKHVLLAFGEYIPLADTFPIIRSWFPDNVGEFGRGKGPTRFDVGGFHFAPVICYESIISSYMRRTAKLDVDFITEVTNDGWYGRTSALLYHKDLTVLRAIENRISIARDTNTGVTTFIDPLGDEHGVLPLESAMYTIHDIPRHRAYAFFTAYGHYFKCVVGTLLALLIVTAIIRYRSH
jgi:apolipoprotein N-acyltransferase